MAFSARYPGRCSAECGVPIHVGDYIAMTDDGPVHAQCQDDDGPSEAATACPTCWLVHPEGTCDR